MERAGFCQLFFYKGKEMELANRIKEVIESKKNGITYVDEVRELLPELCEVMNLILNPNNQLDEDVTAYLLGMVEDTVSGVENQDEVLLRDVLEFGWQDVILDIMGDEDSDNICEE